MDLYGHTCNTATTLIFSLFYQNYFSTFDGTLLMLAKLKLFVQIRDAGFVICRRPGENMRYGYVKFRLQISDEE